MFEPGRFCRILINMKVTCGFFGATGLGKSLAVRTLLGRPHDERLLPTVGASWQEIPQVLVDCKEYTVSLLDTAGDSRYFIMLALYTRPTQIHVLFYNLRSDDKYFYDVYKESEKSGPRVRIVVGTHLGGPVNEEVRAKILEWTKEKGLPYLEVDVFDDASVRNVLVEGILRLK